MEGRGREEGTVLDPKRSLGLGGRDCRCGD